MNIDYNEINEKLKKQDNIYTPINPIYTPIELTLRGFAKVKISRDNGDNEEFFVRVETESIQIINKQIFYKNLTS